MREAKKKLAAMSDPKFISGEEAYDKANAKAKGYSYQERTDFFQNLARQNNTAFRRGTEANPSQASVVNNALKFQSGQALNQFAASDARLQRSQASDLAAAIRSQSNLATSLDIKTQENLGLQYQQSRDRMIRGMKEKSQDIQSFSTMGAGNFGKMTGGNKTSSTQEGQPYYGTPYQYQPAYEQQTYTDYSQPYYKY